MAKPSLYRVSLARSGFIDDFFCFASTSNTFHDSVVWFFSWFFFAARLIIWCGLPVDLDGDFPRRRRVEENERSAKRIWRNLASAIALVEDFLRFFYLLRFRPALIGLAIGFRSHSTRPNLVLPRF